MAFILMELDRKAMRLKGQQVLTGIAVPNDGQLIEKGLYRAIKSGVPITVVNAGGMVLPEESARLGFAASQPQPVSIGAAGFEVTDPMSEVFVGAEEALSLTELTVQGVPLAQEVEGFWIPVRFSGDAEMNAAGWIRQSNKVLEARVLLADGVLLPDVIRVIPIHTQASSFELRSR